MKSSQWNSLKLNSTYYKIFSMTIARGVTTLKSIKILIYAVGIPIPLMIALTRNFENP